VPLRYVSACATGWQSLSCHNLAAATPRFAPPAGPAEQFSPSSHTTQESDLCFRRTVAPYSGYTFALQPRSTKLIDCALPTALKVPRQATPSSIPRRVHFPRPILGHMTPGLLRKELRTQCRQAQLTLTKQGRNGAGLGSGLKASVTPGEISAASYSRFQQPLSPLGRTSMITLDGPRHPAASKNR
jgi:hypothetical protein